MNLQKINQTILGYFELPNLRKINSGWCYYWAYLAYCLYGGELCSTYDHAFWKFNGKYYDSETLEGIDTWYRLPVFIEMSRFKCFKNYVSGKMDYDILSMNEFLAEWDMDQEHLEGIWKTFESVKAA